MVHLLAVCVAAQLTASLRPPPAVTTVRSSSTAGPAAGARDAAGVGTNDLAALENLIATLQRQLEVQHELLSRHDREIEAWRQTIELLRRQVGGAPDGLASSPDVAS